jgi:hypothetical protein
MRGTSYSTTKLARFATFPTSEFGIMFCRRWDSCRAVSFSIAIGSYTFLAASLIGHTVLIGAAAITVATLTAAANNPKLFTSGSGRRNDGEHE